jgi:GNAT superfamily N-acetyltransferase
MIEFRKAGPEDIDKLVRMRLEFLQEVQPKEIWSESEELSANMKQYFSENMASGCFSAWIAVENGETVGTSGLYFYTLPPSYKNKSGKVAYIMNMYTKPEYRGRRIAPTLFGKLIEECKERGCKKISLHATAMGKPVYEKFGFQQAEGEMVLKLL